MIEYKVIREIEKNGSHTQRTLAEALNISVGKVNYILAGFVRQGLITSKKIRNHHDKIRWHYYLTPKGVQEKVKIAQLYFEHLSGEYDMIQTEMATLKKELA
ncbi:MAG: MarR family EPS-associated transcriptional regulator [Fibrobacterota bacterium]